MPNRENETDNIFFHKNNSLHDFLESLIRNYYKLHLSKNKVTFNETKDNRHRIY